MDVMFSNPTQEFSQTNLYNHYITRKQQFQDASDKLSLDGLCANSLPITDWENVVNKQFLIAKDLLMIDTSPSIMVYANMGQQIYDQNETTISKFLQVGNDLLDTVNFVDLNTKLDTLFSYIMNSTYDCSTLASYITDVQSSLSSLTDQLNDIKSILESYNDFSITLGNAMGKCSVVALKDDTKKQRAKTNVSKVDKHAKDYISATVDDNGDVNHNIQSGVNAIAITYEVNSKLQQFRTDLDTII